jgi:hypothetical protein
VDDGKVRVVDGDSSGDESEWSPSRRWRIAAVTALGLLLAVLLVVTDQGTTDVPPTIAADASPTSTTSPSTATTASTIDTDEAAKAHAVSAAEAWITAINNADIEAAYALRSPRIIGAVILYQYEDVMISTASGSTFLLDGCEVTLMDESLLFNAVVDCQLEFTDPVYVATDGGTITWRILVDSDGLVKALPWRQTPNFPTGGSFDQATRAFVEYAELFRPDEFNEACPSGVYPRDTVMFTATYVAFYPSCRQFYVQLQDEIAEWVLTGRPQS